VDDADLLGAIWLFLVFGMVCVGMVGVSNQSSDPHGPIVGAVAIFMGLCLAIFVGVALFIPDPTGGERLWTRVASRMISEPPTYFAHFEANKNGAPKAVLSARNE
jgi:hypothetical protein